MAVTRINRRDLEKILNGGVKELHEVVIKLYGTNCHLCHALKAEFVNISEDFDNIHFYVFNMSDGSGLEKKWAFEGVPNICYVRTRGSRTLVRFMEDPKKPHKEMWFEPASIRKFIIDNRK